MRIIDPSVDLLSITANALALIELAGRSCYKSYHKISETSATEFVKNIVEYGHESVLEHANATLRFICDRGVSHELVRHRLASYCQESTRYCSYTKELTFIRPPWVEQEALLDNIMELPQYNSLDSASRYWLTCMSDAEEGYRYLLSNHKLRPQDARNILPNALKTEVVMTANCREWRHVLKLRCSKKAHPQMQQVMFMALNLLKKEVPVIFDAIEGE